MSREEIFQIEEEYLAKWENEEWDPFYAASGFTHPKLPAIISGGRFNLYRWGLIPAWVKDWAQAMVIMNRTLLARCESLQEKDVIRSPKFTNAPLTLRIL